MRSPPSPASRLRLTSARQVGATSAEWGMGNIEHRSTRRLRGRFRLIISVKMIVCADDFGLRDDINSAVLELCGLGKLSAVSCMVVLERCSLTAVKPLLVHQGRIDIGLHLCL